MRKFVVSVLAFLMLGAGAGLAYQGNPQDGQNSENACEEGRGGNSDLVDSYCQETNG